MKRTSIIKIKLIAINTNGIYTAIIRVKLFKRFKGFGEVHGKKTDINIGNQEVRKRILRSMQLTFLILNTSKNIYIWPLVFFIIFLPIFKPKNIHD